MTNFNPQKYIEAQRKEWNEVAWAWEKWDRWLDESMSCCNEKIVEKAQISIGNSVVDLGSGTGYPSILTAKKVGYGQHGSVIGLDLSEAMLNAAKKKANFMGIHNVMFQVCDVSSIPFEDSSFNAATSRFCLMFLPYIEKTLNEVYRVLKEDGGFSSAVWASKEKNLSLALAFKIIGEFIEIPKSEPSQPGIFSLGEPGRLMNLMRETGFKETNEEEIELVWTYSSGQEYVELLKEMAAPIKAIIEKLPDNAKKEAEEKLAESVESYRDGEKIKISAKALIVSCRK